VDALLRSIACNAAEAVVTFVAACSNRSLVDRQQHEFRGHEQGISAHRLPLVVDRVFGLDDGPDACGISGRRHIGKVIIAGD
jgi:hypothetical protein